MTTISLRKSSATIPDARESVFNDFNQSTFDPFGQIGGDQGMAVLKEMNDLEAGYYEFVKSLAPSVEVL